MNIYCMLHCVCITLVCSFMVVSWTHQNNQSIFMGMLLLSMKSHIIRWLLLQLIACYSKDMRPRCVTTIALPLRLPSRLIHLVDLNPESVLGLSNTSPSLQASRIDGTVPDCSCGRCPHPLMPRQTIYAAANTLDDRV